MSHSEIKFKRIITVDYTQHLEKITVCYQPYGYLDKNTIVLSFDFDTYTSKNLWKHVAQGAYSAAYMLSHTNSVQQDYDINPLEITRNFNAALLDAMEVAEHLIQKIKSGERFEELMTSLMHLDGSQGSISLQPDSQKPIDMQLIHVGNNVIAANNQLWENECVARAALSKLAPEISFEVREGSVLEQQYWMFQFDRNHAQVYAEGHDQQGR